MVLSAFMNTDKIRGCCICWLRLLCRKYPLLSPVKGLCQGIPATRAAQDLLNYMFRRSPKKEHYRMLLPREFIAYLSRELVKKLTPAALETSNPQAVAEIIGNVITEELAVEDRLNDEVRDILQQYSEYMRREGVSYQEMFRKVKNTMIAERKVIRASGRDTHDPMKLSRDKITDMSHKIVTALRKARELRMKRDTNEVRLEIVRDITEVLTAEEKVDRMARQKIRSQKREIPEGSEEWDLLHRKYYSEELKKLGIDLSR